MDKKTGKAYRGLFCVLAVLTVVCAASLSTATDSLTEEERDWLTKHGAIQVGAFCDYPPFGFAGVKGRPLGMSVDFWNLMAFKLGCKVKFHPTPFAKQLKGLKSGQFDSLAGILPLEERKESFDFTREYAVIATYIYVRPRYEDLRGLPDLKGLKVGVVEGDLGEIVAQMAALKQIRFNSHRDAIRALGEESIDAIIMDELVVSYYAARYGLRDRIKRIGEPVDQRQMALPVAKGNVLLLGILNKGVDLVSLQEWTKIREKWIGR